MNQGVGGVLLKHFIQNYSSIFLPHLYRHPLTSRDFLLIKLDMSRGRSERHYDVNIRTSKVEVMSVSEGYYRPEAGRFEGIFRETSEMCLNSVSTPVSSMTSLIAAW